MITHWMSLPEPPAENETLNLVHQPRLRIHFRLTIENYSRPEITDNTKHD